METYFTEEEIREQLIETLEGYGEAYSELSHYAFNEGYYIIGTYEAKQALEHYGIYEAIGRITTYEKEQFGEILTDLSNPEQVANMLYYILSEEYMYNHEAFNDIINEFWNDEAAEEVNQLLITALKDN